MRLNRLSAVLTFAVLLMGSASIVSAQNAVTTADIQRLEDTIDDASRDVAQVRTRDSRLASDLERELNDARDEAIYLKVKLRKNEPVARSQYSVAARSCRRHPQRCARRRRREALHPATVTASPERSPFEPRRLQREWGHSGRNGARRPPANPPQLQDGASRGSFRSDDDG